MNNRHILLFSIAALLASCSDNGGAGEGSAMLPQDDARLSMSIGLYDTGTAQGREVTTRGNGVASGGSMTYGVQNTGQLHSRNYNRVGLFTLTKGGVTAEDDSWEKFNVCSTSATAYGTASDQNYTEVTTESYEQNQLYYPEVRNEEVDVYAYAPYVATDVVQTQLGGTDFNNISSQTIRFTVKQDQTEEDDYVDSDILWGCAGTGTTVAASVTEDDGSYKLLSKTGNHNTVSAEQFIAARKLTTEGRVTSGATAYYRKSSTDNQPDVIVPMLHRGAKIVMKLTTQNMLQNKLKNARVNINLPHIEGQLNISTGEFTANPSEPTHRKAVTLTDRLGVSAAGETQDLHGDFQSDPTIGATSDEEAGDEEVSDYTCTAVVVPQQCSTDFDLIDVTLFAKTTAHTFGVNSNNPPTATYSWRPESAITFESGKQYVFNVTVSAQELQVSTVVTDWNDNSDWDDGEQTPTATQTNSLRVGDLYYSDGTWGPYDPAKTPVGIVFKVGTSEKDQVLGYKHGYAIALKNLSSVAWGPENSNPTGVMFHGGNTDAQWVNVTGDLDGLTHCRTAKANNGGSFSGLGAMNAADTYSPAAPTETGSSEWYLPSIGQWYQVMVAFARSYEKYDYWIGSGRKWEYNTDNGWKTAVETGGTGVMVLKALNEFLASRIPSGTYDDFTHGMWTSTEVSELRAFEMWFDNATNTQYARVYLNANTKKSVNKNVRPVLAF